MHVRKSDGRLFAPGIRRSSGLGFSCPNKRDPEVAMRVGVGLEVVEGLHLTGHFLCLPLLHSQP